MTADELRESLAALRKPKMRPKFKALILALLDEHEYPFDEFGLCRYCGLLGEHLNDCEADPENRRSTVDRLMSEL